LTACSVGDDDGGGGEAATTLRSSDARRTPTSRCKDLGAANGASIRTPASFAVTPWRLDRANLYDALGCVTLAGRPVSGVTVKVNNYVVPEPTDENGGFYYKIDATVPQRATVTVADASTAKSGENALSDDERAELTAATGALTVRFKLTELQSERLPNGTVRVSGSATFDNGAPPPPVVLFAYELTGKVRDRNGRPLGGAVIATRTLDLEVWSFSAPSAPDGTYRSFFYPTGDEIGEVGLTVRASVGDESWEIAPTEVVKFPKLKSATMDVDIPPPGFPLPTPDPPRAVPGAVYEGLLVGAELDGKPVTPLAARWVDRRGHFELLLPADVAGQTISFWESRLYAYSRVSARPGGPVDVSYWPQEFPPRAPRGIATLTLPG